MLELLLNSFTVLLTATIVRDLRNKSVLFVLTLCAAQFSFFIFTHRSQDKGEKLEEEKVKII